MIEITYKVAVNSRYDYNVAYLKKYGDKYKVQVLRCVRKKGVANENYSVKGTVNDCKLDSNLRRAKNTIKELVLCNDWEYFITLTLDKTKYDRYNLAKFNKDLSQYIRDLRKKLKADIKYLLIPEQHSDGAWHMHGFLMGLLTSELKLFDKSEKLPHYIRDKLCKGEKIYNWVGYGNKFGFNSVEAIRDKDKASSYVTKYVTKDIADSVKELNAKLYYCSRGLERSKVVKKGSVTGNYKPSYVKYDDNEEILYSEMWLDSNVSEQDALSYIKVDVNNRCKYDNIVSGFKSIPESFEVPFD